MLVTSGFEHCFLFQKDDNSNVVVSAQNTVVIAKDMIVEYASKVQIVSYRNCFCGRFHGESYVLSRNLFCAIGIFCWEILRFK
jgi:hypothetical protein